MRILFISPRLCLPLNRGNKLREYYLARSLAEHADVTYVSFVLPGVTSPTAEDLPFFRDIHTVPLTGHYSATKIARGLLGSVPLAVLNYTTDEMKATLREVVADGEFDLVHLDATHLAAYPAYLQSRVSRPLPAVFDWHNIESEVYRRYSTGGNSLAKRLYASRTARQLAAVERQILGGSLGHVVCSPREREQLLEMAPDARIAVIENGVDTEYFSQAGTNAKRRRIVFVGAMDYYANVEAVTWFVRQVWPRIAECFPEWRLTLVGSKPGPAVLTLADAHNVEVTGTVEDVRPFYGEALAAIVPLLTGGGTRLKVLEAMAAGVPVVSSTLGAEGLAVTAGEDFLIADGEEAWLPALRSLVEDGAAARLVAAGKRLVKSRYDWRIQGDQLFEKYREWLGK